MRRSLVLLLVSGCTILNDPGMHTGNQPDVPVAADVPEAEQIAYDDFCDELADFLCGSFDRCCSAAEPPADCIAQATEGCDASFGTALLMDSRTGYDPVRAAEVIAQGHELASTCDLRIIPWSRTVIPRILGGIREPAAECTPRPLDGGFDFAALLSCRGDEYSCFFNGLDTWTCAMRVEEGRGCYTSYDCVDGLFCDPPAGGVCRDRLAAGAPCDRMRDECAGACACDGPPPCATGHCVLPSSEAAYCNVFGALL